VGANRLWGAAIRNGPSASIRRIAMRQSPLLQLLRDGQWTETLEYWHDFALVGSPRIGKTRRPGRKLSDEVDNKLPLCSQSR
jgi:hypothetical protein